MTDEELHVIRRRVEMAQAKPHTAYGRGIVYADDTQSLLAYVDFLRALLHDLQQDSAAYQRGVEEGQGQERERLLALCRTCADQYPHSASAFRLLACLVRGDKVHPVINAEEVENPWAW